MTGVVRDDDSADAVSGGSYLRADSGYGSRVGAESVRIWLLFCIPPASQLGALTLKMF